MDIHHGNLDYHIDALKRTKIIATVGPATLDYESVKALIKNGANGLRLNFSHGTHDSHAEAIAWIRQASQELDKPVAIIQDLQGPKIRLGELIDNHYDVHAGDELQLTYGITHDGGKNLPIQYDLAAKVQPGERLYLFDGKIRSKVTAVSGKSLTIAIENDGFLMSKKGLNLPDTDFSGDVVTEKDYADIDFGVDHDIDFVALSFVQSASDIEVLRGYLASKGSSAHIIAKVETKLAIAEKTLDEIVAVSDAVMVARGDLAVEVGAEIVPAVQRRIISLCQQHAKISIVATQMMSSMVDHPEPTRAEVSDVASAVMFGADAVMLSDETANGNYPIETVQSMKRVILHTQEYVPTVLMDQPIDHDVVSMAICTTAVALAKQLHARAIIVETKSGATAQNVSAHRPLRPLFSVTSNARAAQQLALLYANKSFFRPDGERAGLDLASDLVKEGFLAKKSTVVLVSGRQPGLVGGTDTIRVRTID